jgi:cytochrome o ubiquinol oxidase subunit 3
MSQHALQNHHEQEENDTIIFGFWVYLMTDLVMFAVLFASYAVLHGNTFGGPTSNEIFNLPYVLVETLILLTSSFTIGLAMLGVHGKNKTRTLVWLTVTFILGAIFLKMELTEFAGLLHDGAGFTRSAFLSSYFALVGTHGLHILAGLLWTIMLIVVLLRRGFTNSTSRKLMLLSLFWHFLDIVWIFIFTIVYLMGSI